MTTTITGTVATITTRCGVTVRAQKFNGGYLYAIDGAAYDTQDYVERKVRAAGCPDAEHCAEDAAWALSEALMHV